ncbi:hypothetical protein GOODEAATRI_012979 [Goodea atripinnis]|uniref:Uncharacterized protein n=1 Tax=Goodea atripinnis TaxID=208336 RepID=A0ABV0N2C5_9TELE
MDSTLANSTPPSPFCDSFRYWLFQSIIGFLGTCLSACPIWAQKGWSTVCRWHEKVFAEVVQKMSSHRFYSTPQCLVELEKLKCNYKNIKDHNGQTGSNRSLLEVIMCYSECLFYFACCNVKLISC